MRFDRNEYVSWHCDEIIAFKREPIDPEIKKISPVYRLQS